MRLSTKGRYAVTAMMHLAIHDKYGPVTLAEISQCQGISLSYLEQLFAKLRKCSLVEGVRGPGGGYRLARPDGAISVAEIIEAVDEPLSATRCTGEDSGCLAGRKCATHDLWDELGEQIRLFLLGVSLADVVRGQVRGRALPPLLPGMVPGIARGQGPGRGEAEA